MNWFRSIRNQIKSWRSNRAIVRAYGSLNPPRIQIRGNWIHVDPDDSRARKILIADPLRGRFRINLRYWWLGIRFWKPDLLVDVGLNYGEGLFSTRYPAPLRVHGFEANPRLAPPLQKSRAEHPDAERITLHFGVVSDVEDQEIPFHIDTQWSGGSSAGGSSIDSNRYQTQIVRSISVDRAVAGDLDAVEKGLLLFKVDVEGFESRVLKGMSQTFSKAENAVGIVEFSPTLLNKAGANVEEYWAFLGGMFETIVFIRRSRMDTVSGLTYKAACDLLGTREPHGDLLLVKKNEPERIRQFLDQLQSRQPAEQ